MPKNTIQADALLILWAKATVPDFAYNCLSVPGLYLDGPYSILTGSYWTLMVLKHRTSVGLCT